MRPLERKTGKSFQPDGLCEFSAVTRNYLARGFGERTIVSSHLTNEEVSGKAMGPHHVACQTIDSLPTRFSSLVMSVKQVMRKTNISAIRNADKLLETMKSEKIGAQSFASWVLGR